MECILVKGGIFNLKYGSNLKRVSIDSILYYDDISGENVSIFIRNKISSRLKSPSSIEMRRIVRTVLKKNGHPDIYRSLSFHDTKTRSEVLHFGENIGDFMNMIYVEGDDFDMY